MERRLEARPRDPFEPFWRVHRRRAVDERHHALQPPVGFAARAARFQVRLGTRFVRAFHLAVVVQDEIVVGQVQ